MYTNVLRHSPENKILFYPIYEGRYFSNKFKYFKRSQKYKTTYIGYLSP